MQGTNTFKINQSTMQEAIEFWLKNKVFTKEQEGFTVTNVTQQRAVHDNNFEVCITSPEVPQPGKVMRVNKTTGEPM